MRIEEALTQVRAIQHQVARAEQYCCYRWATVAASGVTAVAAGILQPLWVANPGERADAFIAWWVAVAALNVGIVGAEMLLRWVRSDSAYARRQTVMALQQFAPCLIAGALLTCAMRTAAWGSASLLPALWSLLFSLGIFASWRFLPRQILIAAAYYLVAGVLCLCWGQGEQSLQPWTMLVTFAAGQLMTSVILYRYREPDHGDS